MEYTLQTFYYLFRGFLNLIFQMPVAQGVTIGGILMSVLLMTAALHGLGLVSDKADDLKVNGITSTRRKRNGK